MSDVSNFLEWYRNLSEKSLENIGEYYSSDAFFKDPFNNVKGINKIEMILRDMFHKLEKPRFEFLDVIEQGEQVFVTWNFYFSILNEAQLIHGSSHLKFNEFKKVVYHRDYWDVGEEIIFKLPLIGFAYKIFRRKISSTVD